MIFQWSDRKMMELKIGEFNMTNFMSKNNPQICRSVGSTNLWIIFTHTFVHKKNFHCLDKEKFLILLVTVFVRRKCQDPL